MADARGKELTDEQIRFYVFFFYLFQKIIVFTSCLILSTRKMNNGKQYRSLGEPPLATRDQGCWPRRENHGQGHRGHRQRHLLPHSLGNLRIPRC